MKLFDTKWKKIAVSGVAIAVLVLIVGRVFAGRKPQVEYDTYEVKRAALRQTVQVTGEVVSSADVELKFEGIGRVQAVYKKVGDVVKTGEILATLDDRTERARVQSAAASLQSAQANLSRISSGATAEDVHVAEVAVLNAQSALEQARQAVIDTQNSNESSLSRVYGDLDGQMENLSLRATAAMQVLKNDVFEASGTLKSDILCPDFGLQTQALSQYTAANAALLAMTGDIGAYRAAVSRAEKDRLAARLIDEGKTIRASAQSANAMLQISTPIGGTGQASFDARKSEVKATWTEINAAVNAAEAQKLLIATTLTTNASALTGAQQGVRSAEASLATATATLNLKKAPAASYDLAAARASVSQASASLSEASVALDRRRIRAPYEGMIAAALGRVGATASSNDVMFKLHGNDVYEIEGDVPETDVAKLRSGMKAEITLDAYGDDTLFPGELASIDTAQTVIQDVVYYKTRFRFATAEPSIRAGMTANVTVVAQERADALLVPQRAIKHNGEKYVRLLENGQEAKRSVETGLYGDDGLVEISSGLSGGETVVLAARQNGKILKEE